MRLLLDTNILIWLSDEEAYEAARLDTATRAVISDRDNDVAFSIVSVWEVAIKFALGRPSFGLDPTALRSGLLAAGFAELPIKGDHALVAGRLPPIHRDPFDRMLVAQAQVEGLTLITGDATIARYPGPIRLI